MRQVSLTILITVLLISLHYLPVDSSSVIQKNIGRREDSLSSIVRRKKTSIIDSIEKRSQIVAQSATGVPSPLKLVGLFTFWYAFNAAYNVFNAYVKKDFGFPNTIAATQLLVGLFYAVPLWLLGRRKLPKISVNDFLTLLPIAVLNALGHASTVNAMFQKGGGSFTHVIKAAEPVVSVLLSLVVLGAVPKPFTAISLLPITYGVAYASTLGDLNPATMVKELTTKAAMMAMASNVAFSMRSILRKQLPADFKFAVTTIISFLLILPFIFTSESLSAMRATIQALPNKQTFLLNNFICGMAFYLYNELQNIVLSSLGPVPTAVGNTLKRVAIFVALYFFTPGESFPLPKVVGCTIAVLGCLAFAVCDSKKL
eukprot:gene28852-37860_t